MARQGLVGLLCLGVAVAALADQVIDQARKFIEQRNPRAAYELLAPLEPQRAGEIEFDYYLGVAALDAGNPHQAVFALERVLAVNPNFLQARAEIARAYYVLGERQTARREFEAVKSQGVPPGARETIDRYLSALAPQRTEVRAYIEATGGWDSNVNSATSKTAIAIPQFGGVIAQLNPVGVRESSGFGGLGAGVSLSHALSEQWYLIGAASYAGKYNFDVDGFDTGQVDASAGARWASGNHQVLAIGQFQRFSLDYETYRNSAGGTVQWLYNLSPSQQVTVFAQYASLTYPDQDPRDANRYIGGVGYSQAFAAPYSPVMFASLYGGEEKERDSAFPWLGFKPLGLRLGGQLSLTDRALLFASASYEHRSYNGSDPLFLTRRRDDQADARLGLAYTAASNWTLTPQIAYTYNFSNIELYEYERVVGSVSVRRDF
jgi:tetratricopeptide (TPR) repeat protein